MKTSNKPNAGVTLALKGFFMLLVFLPAASCRKNNMQASTPPADMKQVASVLEGTLLSSSITTESDDEGVAIFYNDGTGLIAMGNIPSSSMAFPGNIERAEIVCSSYGVVVRDVVQNKLWLYIQNDEKSRKKFESLPSFENNPLVSSITETVWINSLGSWSKVKG